jgi:EAL domain-containing protein (putative c-di-GMP-specific phosphodiesterase class I)/AmiR/NasT family two-component response regulator
MHRVLIVEDDPFMLDSLRRHVARSFDVETAENGHEGLFKLKERGPFAAVISDLQMRGMCGIEFLEAASGIAPDTPRVLFTGYADRDTMASAINRASVYRILEKPTPPAEFMNCIKDCIERFTATHALKSAATMRAPRDDRWIAEALKTVDFNQDFQLRYQPRVNSSTGIANGAEVLVRWFHGRTEAISPVDFIPVAEKTGVIREVTLWVLLGACRGWTAWRQSRGTDVALSVNISPVLFSQTDLVGLISMVLSRTGMDPSRLELEITEGIELTDFGLVRRTIEGLRKLGVKLSIDDFGTGFSSMQYLQKLDVDCVKIDRAFVQNAPRSDRDRTILKALRTLTEDLGMSTVAEGIETQGHEDLVRDIGINEMQGYRFAKPLEEAEFLSWMDARSTFGIGGPSIPLVTA